MVHIALRESWDAETKKKNHLLSWRSFPPNNNEAHPKGRQKGRNRSIYGRILSMVGTINKEFIYILILYTFSIQ